MTRPRVDMAAGSSPAFPLAAGIWAPGAAVGLSCLLRSARAQSGPGGEDVVRKKAREEGGGKVEGNRPPSHGNELLGLASPGRCPAHSSWHSRSSFRGQLRKWSEDQGGAGRAGPHLQAPGLPRVFASASLFWQWGWFWERSDTLLLLPSGRGLLEG